MFFFCNSRQVPQSVKLFSIMVHEIAVNIYLKQVGIFTLNGLLRTVEWPAWKFVQDLKYFARNV